MRTKHFLSLLALAVAAITAVWTSFNSFYDLVPPVAGGFDVKILSGLSSIFSVGVLLIILILMPKKTNRLQRVRFGIVGAVCLIISAAWFFYYIGDLRRHQYSVPNVSPCEAPSCVKYVRGEIVDEIYVDMLKKHNGSLYSVFVDLGGLQSAQKLLWTAESQIDVEKRLMFNYLGLTAFFSCTLFFLGVVVRPQDS